MVELRPRRLRAEERHSDQDTTRSAGGQPGRHHLTHFPNPPLQSADRSLLVPSRAAIPKKFFAASSTTRLAGPVTGITALATHSLTRLCRQPNGHGSLLALMLPCRLVSVLLLLLHLLFVPLPMISCVHVTAAADGPATAHGAHAQDDDGTAWRSFKQLLDARRGSHVAGLAELKRYLARFGYMPSVPGAAAAHDDDPTSSPPPSTTEDAFDAHMEAAVRRYQTTLSLPVTGQLDSATLALIMAPRCGVGDHHDDSHVVSRFTFFKGEPRWTQPDPLVLTYAVSRAATVGYLPMETVRAVFRRAFARWARVIPVGFEETEDYEGADIRVGFYAGGHGDGIPFDGPLGVLGHAFSPRNGRLHLDAAERWAVDMDAEAESARSAVDLESVATHEIGHVLGLGHSSSPRAVMYPSLRPRERKAELTVDDIEGVQWLYGPNPGFSLSSLYQDQQSSAVATTVRSSWFPPASAASLVCAVLVILVTQL